MEINYLLAKELDEVIALHKQIFHEDNKTFFEALKEKPYYKVFVASHKNRIVAYCIISEIQDEAELFNIGVESNYRRQKIATKLLLFALNNIDAKTCYLEVSNKNAAAIGLYKKAGFAESYIRKKYYGDSDAIIMVRTKE